MFRLIYLFVLLSFASFADEKKEIDPEKLSEALGHMIGKNLSDMGLDLDVKQVIKGLKNGSDNKESPMSEEECLKALSLLQEKVLEKISEKNLIEANSFLQNNIKDQSVIELEKDKLQYKILTPGIGKSIAIYNSPIVRYVGKYINGDKFINQEERVSLNEIIPGLSKGLIGMKEGEKRIIYMHPSLGFGKQTFNPNALLIFEVEVVKADGGSVQTPPEIADKKVR
ncbi:MAG: FKBP-type peptidyl-prolyl cis-trans isomerase [Chlamydiae bacterium]|nr:FKBP-type peptidyl-prolyl cis-trans isomerase [Chlamydiota bacterium]